MDPSLFVCREKRICWRLRDAGSAAESPLSCVLEQTHGPLFLEISFSFCVSAKLEYTPYKMRSLNDDTNTAAQRMNLCSTQDSAAPDATDVIGPDESLPRSFGVISHTANQHIAGRAPDGEEERKTPVESEMAESVLSEPSHVRGFDDEALPAQAELYTGSEISRRAIPQKYKDFVKYITDPCELPSENALSYFGGLTRAEVQVLKIHTYQQATIVCDMRRRTHMEPELCDVKQVLYDVCLPDTYNLAQIQGQLRATMLALARYGETLDSEDPAMALVNSSGSFARESLRLGNLKYVGFNTVFTTPSAMHRILQGGCHHVQGLRGCEVKFRPVVRDDDFKGEKPIELALVGHIEDLRFIPKERPVYHVVKPGYLPRDRVLELARVGAVLGASVKPRFPFDYGVFSDLQGYCFLRLAATSEIANEMHALGPDPTVLDIKTHFGPDSMRPYVGVEFHGRRIHLPVAGGLLMPTSLLLALAPDNYTIGREDKQRPTMNQGFLPGLLWVLLAWTVVLRVIGVLWKHSIGWDDIPGKCYLRLTPDDIGFFPTWREVFSTCRVDPLCLNLAVTWAGTYHVHPYKSTDASMTAHYYYNLWLANPNDARLLCRVGADFGFSTHRPDAKHLLCLLEFLFLLAVVVNQVFIGCPHLVSRYRNILCHLPGCCYLRITRSWLGFFPTIKRVLNSELLPGYEGYGLSWFGVWHLTGPGTGRSTVHEVMNMELSSTVLFDYVGFNPAHVIPGILCYLFFVVPFAARTQVFLMQYGKLDVRVLEFSLTLITIFAIVSYLVPLFIGHLSVLRTGYGYCYLAAMNPFLKFDLGPWPRTIDVAPYVAPWKNFTVDYIPGAYHIELGGPVTGADLRQLFWDCDGCVVGGSFDEVQGYARTELGSLLDTILAGAGDTFEAAPFHHETFFGLLLMVWGLIGVAVVMTADAGALLCGLACILYQYSKRIPGSRLRIRWRPYGSFGDWKPCKDYAKWMRRQGIDAICEGLVTEKDGLHSLHMVEKGTAYAGFDVLAKGVEESSKFAGYIDYLPLHGLACDHWHVTYSLSPPSYARKPFLVLPHNTLFGVVTNWLMNLNELCRWPTCIGPFLDAAPRLYQKPWKMPRGVGICVITLGSASQYNAELLDKYVGEHEGAIETDNPMIADYLRANTGRKVKVNKTKDHYAWFSRAATVLCHGGAGTMEQARRAGAFPLSLSEVLDRRQLMYVPQDNTPWRILRPALRAMNLRQFARLLVTMCVKANRGCPAYYIPMFVVIYVFWLTWEPLMLLIVLRFIGSPLGVKQTGFLAHYDITRLAIVMFPFLIFTLLRLRTQGWQTRLKLLAKGVRIGLEIVVNLLNYDSLFVCWIGLFPYLTGVVIGSLWRKLLKPNCPRVLRWLHAGVSPFIEKPDYIAIRFECMSTPFWFGPAWHVGLVGAGKVLEMTTTTKQCKKVVKMVLVEDGPTKGAYRVFSVNTPLPSNLMSEMFKDSTVFDGALYTPFSNCQVAILYVLAKKVTELNLWYTLSGTCVLFLGLVWVAGFIFSLGVVLLVFLLLPFIRIGAENYDMAYSMLSVLFVFGERDPDSRPYLRGWLSVLRPTFTDTIKTHFEKEMKACVQRIAIIPSTIDGALNLVGQAYEDTVQALHEIRVPTQTSGRPKVAWAPLTPAMRQVRAAQLSVSIAANPKFVLTDVETEVARRMRLINLDKRVQRLELVPVVRRDVRRKLDADDYSHIVGAEYVDKGMDGQTIACREVMAASLYPYTRVRPESQLSSERAKRIARALCDNAPEMYYNARLFDPSFGLKQFLKHPKYSAGIDLCSMGLVKRAEIKSRGLQRALMRLGMEPFVTGTWRSALMHAVPKSQVVARARLAVRPDKARSITATSIVENISQSVLFGDLNKRMDWRAYGKGGLPLNGRQVGRIFELHSQKTFHYSMDITGFDRNEGPECMMIIEWVRKMGYESSPLYPVLCKHIECAIQQTRMAKIVNLVTTPMDELEGLLGDKDRETWLAVPRETKEELRRVSANILDLSNPRYPGGIITKVDGGGTGDVNTSKGNTIGAGGPIIDCVCRNLNISPEVFNELVVLSNQSDDNVVSTDQELDIEKLVADFKRVYGLTVRVESAGTDILQQSFLAKIPRPGFEYLEDFELIGQPVPKFAILHDPERLRRSIAQHKMADAAKLKGNAMKVRMYHIQRMSGHMMNCAHQKALFEKLKAHVDSILWTIPAKYRKKVSVPDYKKVLQAWYSNKRDDDFMRAHQLRYTLGLVQRSEVVCEEFVHFSKSILVAPFRELGSIPDVMSPPVTASDGFFEEFMTAHFYHKNGRLPSLVELTNLVRLSAFSGFCCPDMYLQKQEEDYWKVHGLEKFRLSCWEMIWFTTLYVYVHKGLNYITYLPFGRVALGVLNLYRFDLPGFFSSFSHLSFMVTGTTPQYLGKLMPKDRNYYIKACAAWLAKAIPIPSDFSTLPVERLCELVDGAIEIVGKFLQPRLTTSLMVADPTDVSPWTVAATDALALLERHNVCTLTSPCGSGKTRYLPSIINGLASATVIVLLPRRVLCSEYIKRNPGVVWKKSNVPETSKLMVMTYGYYVTARYEGNCTWLCADTIFICDEAHENSVHWEVIIKNYLNLHRTILLTATPISWMKVFPVINVEVETPFQVTDQEPHTKDLLTEFVFREKTSNRVLVVEPSATQGRRLVASLKTMGYQIEHLSAKSPLIPQSGHVVATSIADASLTIPGCDCVIDSGFSLVNESGLLKRVVYDKPTQTQRRGRTGRTCPGVYVSFESPVSTSYGTAPSLDDLLEDNFIARHYPKFKVGLDVNHDLHLPGNVYAFCSSPPSLRNDLCAVLVHERAMQSHGNSLDNYRYMTQDPEQGPRLLQLTGATCFKSYEDAKRLHQQAGVYYQVDGIIGHRLRFENYGVSLA